MIVDAVPQMFGRTLNAFEAAFRIDPRPRCITQDARPRNDAFARMLFDACCRRDGRELSRALDALQMSMSDSPDIMQDLKESLFALAADGIADIPNSRKGKGNPIDRRLHALLDPLFAYRRRLYANRSGNSARTLIAVFWAVRRRRNSFWHPRADRTGARFSRQLLVHPLMIAVAMTYVPLVARLVELGRWTLSSEYVVDVFAITAWLRHLGPELQAGLVHPDDARNLGTGYG